MSIYEQIKEINKEWGLDTPAKPEWQSSARIRDFYEILREELEEYSDAIHEVDTGNNELAGLVALADWLGDIIYYCYSEAARWGIPMDQVLQAILFSQLSKRFPDGTFHRDSQNKIIKGPSNVAPEKNIEKVLINAQLIGDHKGVE